MSPRGQSIGDGIRLGVRQDGFRNNDAAPTIPLSASDGKIGSLILKAFEDSLWFDKKTVEKGKCYSLQSPDKLLLLFVRRFFCTLLIYSINMVKFYKRGVAL